VTNVRGACLLLAAGAIVGTGCQSDDRVAVTGTVTLDGQPLEQGVISFRPSDGNRPTAEALIVAGKFNAQLTTGEKRVEVQGFRQNGLQHAFADDPTSPLVPRLEPIVPPRYHVDSMLRLNVDRATREANFALTTASS